MESSSTDAGEASASAFGAYVEPEIVVLLRVATTLTGRTAGAEDLVQETCAAQSRPGRRLRLQATLDRIVEEEPR